jgi:hypothetical protein
VRGGTAGCAAARGRGVRAASRGHAGGRSMCGGSASRRSVRGGPAGGRSMCGGSASRRSMRGGTARGRPMRCPAAGRLCWRLGWRLGCRLGSGRRRLVRSSGAAQTHEQGKNCCCGAIVSSSDPLFLFNLPVPRCFHEAGTCIAKQTAANLAAQAAYSTLLTFPFVKVTFMSL